MATLPRLVAFYRGGEDDAGRTLDDILRWGHDRLEHTHDFIQWIFPLTERSMANPDAPVLSADDVREFRRDPALRQRLLESLSVMRKFYGLEPPGPRTWLRPGNHNYLRLTRILRSLRTLGLEREARALFDQLEAIYRENAGLIGERTHAYWEQAMRDEVWPAS